jgi:hypothetical protein
LREHVLWNAFSSQHQICREHWRTHLIKNTRELI